MARASRQLQRAVSDREMKVFATSLISIMTHLAVISPENGGGSDKEQASCNTVTTNSHGERPGGARQKATGTVKHTFKLTEFLDRWFPRTADFVDQDESPKLDDWLRSLPSMSCQAVSREGTAPGFAEIRLLPHICEKLVADDDVLDTVSAADSEELLSYELSPKELQQLKSFIERLTEQGRLPSMEVPQFDNAIDDLAHLIARQVEILHLPERENQLVCRDYDAWTRTAELAKEDTSLCIQVTDNSIIHPANRASISEALKAIIAQVAPQETKTQSVT